MIGRYEITGIKARQVLDSRGNPTVECEVQTKGGGFGRAIVPSGKSKGKFEAVEIRDGGTPWKGLGVTRAVSNINNIIKPVVLGMDSRNQEDIDYRMIELDGTENKSKLGANAILAVSLANAVACADTKDVPLYSHLNLLFGKPEMVIPVPFMNIINGGLHAGNKLAVQEFMIAPIGAESFVEAMQMATEVYHELGNILVSKFGKSAIALGDEGGYSPPLRRTTQALDLLLEAIHREGYEKEVKLSIDAAASTFWDKRYYHIDGKRIKPDTLFEFYVKLVNDYPIVNIEDPFHEEDFDSFAKLVSEIGKDVQITGDDIFVTNPRRIEQGIARKSANALLLKVNQIGTLTEAMQSARLSYSNKWYVMVSHRSGDTEDTFISDLSVALSTGEIKAGAPARGERTSKYNRLLRIEEESGFDYAGKRWNPK